MTCRRSQLLKSFGSVHWGEGRGGGLFGATVAKSHGTSTLGVWHFSCNCVALLLTGSSSLFFLTGESRAILTCVCVFCRAARVIHAPAEVGVATTVSVLMPQTDSEYRSSTTSLCVHIVFRGEGRKRIWKKISIFALFLDSAEKEFLSSLVSSLRRLIFTARWPLCERYAAKYPSKI